MRINLHPNRNVIHPSWFNHMINEWVEEFRKEYSVNDKDVYRYFFSDKLDRIQKLFADHGVAVETYEVEDLPSRGIIIPDDDPIVVMYKLKYGNPQEES